MTNYQNEQQLNLKSKSFENFVCIRAKKNSEERFNHFYRNLVEAENDYTHTNKNIASIQKQREKVRKLIGKALYGALYRVKNKEDRQHLKHL